jgi:hypothetical protein
MARKKVFGIVLFLLTAIPVTTVMAIVYMLPQFVVVETACE